MGEVEGIAEQHPDTLGEAEIGWSCGREVEGGVDGGGGWGVGAGDQNWRLTEGQVVRWVDSGSE